VPAPGDEARVDGPIRPHEIHPQTLPSDHPPTQFPATRRPISAPTTKSSRLRGFAASR
jgi:hypothetical protein